MDENNRKIKILFTIPNFNTAGSGKVLYDLVRGLDPEYFELSIVCNHDRGELYKQVKALGVQIYLLQSTVPFRPYFNLVFRMNHFRNFIKTHQFDIVHSWNWSSDWTEALAVRLSGVKWLYTKKAMGFDSVHWKIRSYLANFIVTINNEMQAYFPNKKQQALIPLGIDSDYYNASAFDAKPSSSTNEFHIITVANLVPVKGIEVLINAVHKLNDTSVKLTILGDHTGEYGDAMIALKESLDMHQQVRFIGKQLDVRPKLAASDLYVIPTLDQGRKEGMPMALVEAMCMGIPVLGSNITGINFVLKDFEKYLFQPGNIDDLTEKINAIRSLSIDERKELATSLRDYCLEYFSLEAFIKGHEALYLNLTKIKC